MTSNLKFWACRIGIKWATVRQSETAYRIKYTNHLEKATVWTSSREARRWHRLIVDKYPLAEVVSLKLVPKENT